VGYTSPITKDIAMPNNSDGETRVVSRKGRPGDSIIPPTVRPVLKVLAGASEGRTFRIESAETTIGRSQEADIHLDDEAMSRFHAQILFHNMEFRIKDLESANGTILNGSEVSEYALRHNDKIMVGETMLLFTIDRI